MSTRPSLDQEAQSFGKSDKAEIDLSLTVFKEAFQDDPLFVFLNSDRSHVGQSVADYAASALVCASDGEFYATKSFKSVVWCYHMPEQLPLEPAVQHVPVFPRLEEYFHEWQSAFYKAHGPFFYFAIVATVPAMHRTGLAGRLLAMATATADKQGKWCWVEASSLGSSILYARHGFKTVHECVSEPGCPVVRFMERGPIPLQATES